MIEKKVILPVRKKVLSTCQNFYAKKNTLNLPVTNINNNKNNININDEHFDNNSNSMIIIFNVTRDYIPQQNQT